MQILNNIFPLQPETLNEINKRAERLRLAKQEPLIGAQSICDSLYFVLSGSIKSYHTDEGKEHTTWIYFEEEMVTSWHSYIFQIPSIESFKANEPTELLSLKREDIDYLKKHHIDFVHLLNTYYEFAIGFFDHFIKRIPTLSAKENYNFIFENYPKLIQRASNSDIAAIIGVSRETISRIRTQK